jgi:hypothetical protein
VRLRALVTRVSSGASGPRSTRPVPALSFAVTSVKCTARAWLTTIPASALPMALTRVSVTRAAR